jgi:Protein of unknown function (DUF1194)
MACSSMSILPKFARAAATAAGLAALASPALARDGNVDVDVELVFAVDISYSMDRYEQQLQREGYVKALTSPEFLNALKSNAFGKIAVSYMQWASYNDQDVLLRWEIIDGPESAKEVADKLARAPYRRAQRTSISGAIDAGARLFENNGLKGTRQVLDISGDGPNNNGRIVTQARDDALAQGLTINGLPLVGIREWFSPADIRELDVYYEDCVIGGPEAFMVPIRDTKSFIDATRTKLIREVASAQPQSIGDAVRHASGKVPRGKLVDAREPRISCTIGESLWRGRWGN